MLAARVRRRAAGGAPLSRRSSALGAAAAALALCVYAGSLGHPFVFDDAHTVVGNPSIRHLDNLRWIFIGSRRFVTNFSYAVDWALWGARPFGFHLTNLLLHAANALLLFFLARRLLRDDAGAFLAAGLFAVHPLACETVIYVSSRAGLLCTFFLVAGTWAWHRALADRRRWWLLGAAASWLLAGASKETGLLAPLLWVTCDRLLVNDEPLARRRRLLRWYLPAALLAVAAGSLRLASFYRLEGGGARSMTWHLLTQAEVLWRYLFLLIAPVGLSVVHSVAPVRSLYDPLAWLSATSLLLFAALLLAVRRAAPVATFGGVWLLALLLPSSLVPLLQEMAEHRVYESLAGAALLVAATVAPLRRRYGARAVTIAGAVILCALGVATLLRARVWSSAVSLWEDAAAKAPREWSAHYALGDALRESDRCDRAVESYRAALALRPSELRARRNLAICLATLGRFDDAEAQLQEAITLAPRDPTLHYNLGIVEVARGRVELARTHLLRAAALDPNYPLPCAELHRLFAADPTLPACASPSPGQLR